MQRKGRDYISLTRNKAKTRRMQKLHVIAKGQLQKSIELSKLNIKEIIGYTNNTRLSVQILTHSAYTTP